MRPRQTPRSGADEIQPAAARWTPTFYVLVGVSCLAFATINEGKSQLNAVAQPLVLSCMQWHEQASAAISQMVRSATDVDLRQAADAVFRLRRARRNCEAGWLQLACLDYYAVAKHSPAFAQSAEEFSCARSP
jgi:hypothetical protein